MAKSREQRRQEAEARAHAHTELSLEDRYLKALEANSESKETKKLEKQLRSTGKLSIGPERPGEEERFSASQKKAILQDTKRLERMRDRYGWTQERTHGKRSSSKKNRVTR